MFRVSSGMFVQKNRKIGNSGLARIEKIGKIGNFALTNRRKIGKSKVLLSTKIASLPHQGYNKGYESSYSMFTGFRSTFAAKKE